MVQWFPGHMAKTKRLINENLKLVDVVMELVDARLPVSSRNPLINEIVGNKPTVLVLNKADMAEEEYTKRWVEYYKQQGIVVLPFNSAKNIGRNEKKKLLKIIRNQASDELERRVRKGIKNEVVKLMILGIPNVGKSTLINNLIGRSVTGTGNKPGVTRGKQWVRLEGDIDLLDMPGILWPKFEDPVVGMKLAVTGAIKWEVYDSLELTLCLLNFLIKNKPGRITERYKVEEDDSRNVLENICQRRGFIMGGGKSDLERGANIFLAEYRAGKLGKVTMDEVPV
ncbi:MAG: ribosome biogenesis GTPase YlqF [Clostridia bacterium]|nr:ribosome biogenesis GTPase YlqF [Clostridia bacterium]MDD4048880.1 ribosome biogenesis GTPase YlqF [Clostridia bacterium]